ncbi:MAG: ComEA family DNA-binding protein [Synechococcales cyanobacterium RM1_1_8]|nr:ComEA family DNA-binding protein [Synechococcales cyanobacterium RM1_1_8]
MVQVLAGRLEANPGLRFEGWAELRAAAALGVRIEVAQAGLEDWLRLPGLSIHQARSLTQLLQSGVQLHCLEDLAAALGLPLAQVAGYGPILRFCFYGPDELPLAVAVNQAGAEALGRLPEMDEAGVAALLAERSRGGRFRDLVDFQQRLGLDAGAIEAWMYYLRF